jgi:23S rRNA (cytosine1962-C5)-methyltransferase
MQLPDAPAPGKRAAVRVTADALRQIRGGHPWVFEDSIRSVSGDPASGDLAVIFDDKRRFAAIGLWDPSSPIRVKILHAGRPTAIDGDFWTSRLSEAIDRRRSLIERADTSAYRLVHGENDSLAGLIVDQYDDTLVVKLYTAAWLPHLRAVLDSLVDLTAPARLVLRLSRQAGRDLSGTLDVAQVVMGSEPREPVEFLENGLRFTADVVHGQKTGHFLDQRDNRARVRDLSAGADVLDVFCHTGGFSVHAAAGGATSVLSVDRSRAALVAVDQHFLLNSTSNSGDIVTGQHETRDGDAFEVLADLGRRGRRFGLVVIDPPTFASRQSDVQGAIRAYRKLTELGAAVVSKGGTLVQASCSSRVSSDQFAATVEGGLRSAGADYEITEVSGHAIDHPVGFREGAYLKAVFAQL